MLRVSEELRRRMRRGRVFEDIKRVDRRISFLGGVGKMDPDDGCHFINIMSCSKHPMFDGPGSVV